MRRLFTHKRMLSIVIVFALALTFAGGALLRGGLDAAHAGTAPFKDYASHLKYVQDHHKAPFGFDYSFNQQGGDLKTKMSRLKNQFTKASSGNWKNVKVNQDRNPWPKAEIGSAVDPIKGKNYVVMSNDFRENYDHMFFHPSTDGGKHFTDDSMVGGINEFTGAPMSFQSDPGVALDGFGNGALSTIAGDLTFDFVNGYINNDTEIEVAWSYAGGTYASLVPTVVDYQPCNGTFTAFTCPAQLDKPLITIDNVKGSPNYGRVYVYYTLFCNATPCTDGSATIPAFSSAILESHADSVGGTFSAPALVSGSLNNTQFSSLVVDSSGTPHIFFDDFTNPQINMYESTLTGGAWVVNSTPVATFSYNGLNNPNWGFRDNGTVAPGCSIYQNTAYCAFSASQIGSGPTSPTPNVYVTKVDTGSGASTITRVNNDPANDNKHHFFPWASTSPSGAVYVGWYDDRRDPFNTKVEYWVGKSTDGAQTFPTQKAVSDVSFNPCVGFPGCSFFGDYTQLVTGPDGVTHAAWSDTRDGASMQIYSQSFSW